MSCHRSRREERSLMSVNEAEGLQVVITQRKQLFLPLTHIPLPFQYPQATINTAQPDSYHRSSLSTPDKHTSAQLSMPCNIEPETPPWSDISIPLCSPSSLPVKVFDILIQAWHCGGCGTGFIRKHLCKGVLHLGTCA